jgi:hypothetical protein
LRLQHRLQLTDPDGTVARGAANCLVTAGYERAGRPGQAALRMRIEQSVAAIKQPVLEPRKAVGAVDLAQYCRAVVTTPVDGALRLARRGLPGAPRLVRAGDQRAGAGRDAIQRCSHRCNRRVGHLISIQAALGSEAHRERRIRPHRPCIQLGDRLQHGDTPDPHAMQDRPIERRRTAISGWPRMHDQTQMAHPH